MLHGIPTRIYYDALTMDSPAEVFYSSKSNPYFTLFSTLESTFSDIEFLPSVTGRHIEWLRKKLLQLSTENTNEIVSGNIEEIVHKVQAECTTMQEHGMHNPNLC